MVKSAKPAKKIEEDYTMFDEGKDDELEDIIEEEIEEDEDEREEEEEDNQLTSQEEREERREKREELRTLKTQMLTIREKLNMKTMRIEEIKDTLKRSQLLTRGSIGAIKDITGGIAGVAEEDVIDEVIKEFENQEEEAE